MAFTVLGVGLFIIGVCCSKGKSDYEGYFPEESKVEEEEQEKPDETNGRVKSKSALMFFGEVLSPSLRQKASRGVYVSIMQNIGASSDIGNESIEEGTEQPRKLDSFMGSAPNPFQFHADNQIKGNSNLENKQFADRIEASFPISNESHENRRVIIPDKLIEN